MPPSIIDLSVATCVAGNEQMAIDALGCIPNIEFVNLTTASEQLMAFKSMQACSNVRMTPYEIHWAATCVAGGGVSSFAKAGDRDGALVGLSEANRQPVYIGTTTVQDKIREAGRLFTFPPQFRFPLRLASPMEKWLKSAICMRETSSTGGMGNPIHSSSFIRFTRKIFTKSPSVTVKR